MKRRLWILSGVLILCLSSIAFADSFLVWRQAMRHFSGMKNLHASLRIHFELIDLDSELPATIGQELRIDLWVRDFYDYRIDFINPEIFAGLTMLYLHQEQFLYVLNRETEEAMAQKVDIDGEELNPAELITNILDFLLHMPDNIMMNMTAQPNELNGFTYTIHVLPSPLFTIFRKEYPDILVVLDEQANIRSIDFVNKETAEHFGIQILHIEINSPKISEAFQLPKTPIVYLP